MKRNNYISWDEYFMGIAILSSSRSKDPGTQVGCCIVTPENKISSLGYNGFPRGCSDDEFPWEKNNKNELDNKYLYVCHAEINAILNSNNQLKNNILYVTLFPCNECAKAIIQSGIKEVVYIDDKYANTKSIVASKRMFDSANVKYRQYKKTNKKIIIDL